ncbi:hypothetical protein L1286_05925 [Pseudoalteromonas sp. SMS1]|uniref:hypothetical protein n=1 Tax=Pseudoalteromonas sp. SMS1 TaxID=2908894 RepID=UPI001F1CC397|nr:hypothetical protein [Pseudoalteromonas sp. SMS1]MCF2856996.1 hypothetical protein [Pseudoalteromonas sp. SMS1]
MKNTLPEIEGTYFMIDGDGNKKQVKIENMALSENHPRNLHVIESELEYYALSIENGCEQYTWEKL